MKKIVAEFKEFIARGNVLDMAVGIIIGTSFTAIVNSLVNDVVMPFVGWLIGGIHFADLRVILSPAEGDVAEVAIRYGAFIEKIIDFLLIALVVFLMVKMMNMFHDGLRKTLKKGEQPAEEAEAAPEPAPVAEEILLLREIRDSLKKSEE
jgi:large conductance mechanosensitive channel